MWRLPRQAAGKARVGLRAPQGLLYIIPFKCVSCGYAGNVDVNAALNILALGTGAAGRGGADDPSMDMQDSLANYCI